MIVLTDQQLLVLENEESPAVVVNPRTNETFILLRANEYQRLVKEEYDDSPWTRKDLEALAWERGSAQVGRMGKTMKWSRKSHETW